MQGRRKLSGFLFYFSAGGRGEEGVKPIYLLEKLVTVNCKEEWTMLRVCALVLVLCIFYVRKHTFIYAISDLSFAHIWAFIAYISLHLFPLL